MKTLTVSLSVLCLFLTACRGASGGSDDGTIGDSKGAVEGWQVSALGQEGHGGDAIVCFSIPIERAIYEEKVGSANDCVPGIPCVGKGSTGPGQNPGSSVSGSVWKMTEVGRKSIQSAKPLEQYLGERIASKKILLDQLNQMPVEEGYRKVLAPFTKLPAAFHRISKVHRQLGWLSEDGIKSEYGLLDINDSGFVSENEIDKAHCKELQAVIRRDDQLWYDADIVSHFDNAGMVLIQLHEELYSWGKSQDQINWQIPGPPAHNSSTKTRRLILKVLDADIDASILNENLKTLGFSTMYWETLFKVPTPIGYYMDADSCVREQQFLKKFISGIYGRDFWLNLVTLFEDRYLNFRPGHSTIQLQHNFPVALSNMIALTMNGDGDTFAAEFARLQATFERPDACEGRF